MFAFPYKKIKVTRALLSYQARERERASDLTPKMNTQTYATRVTIFEIHHNIHLKWRACSSASEDNREIARVRGWKGSFDDGPLQLILFKAESAVPKIRGEATRK